MPALTKNSKTILDMRYVDKQHDKNVDGLWDRVSMGNPEYRRMMSELYFLPNSPTLFNLGLPLGGTLSACFVFDVEDCLLGDWPNGGNHLPAATSILGTNFKAACVAKAGGGVGYYFGKVRPRGTEVKSTHKKACGPVTVLRYYNFLRTLITQGGKRDLAQMGVLDAHHPDIMEWIHAKDADPQALSAFNISVSWRDKELKQVWGNYGFKEVWDEQCKSAWQTGCPGMLFWDTINKANATPHLGDINATNPCGETPNLSNEPCNLGSMAVCRFVEGRGKYARINWDMLEAHVRLAIRYMDDILTANVFPHPDITQMALATRKLGLGVMGWADLLALMHIPYDSNEAVDLGEELAKFQNETALSESVKLADERGAYPAYETAPEEVKKRFPRARNSTRTSIAPTGTIAMIAGVWGSIEPYFAHDCSRTTYEGVQMQDGVPEWVKTELNDFNDHRPKIASEIHWSWHIKHQAAFQKHTDLGVSKTVNMPNNATVQDVSDAYRMMWETGCKGGTIFRDGCRDDQVLVKKETSVYAVSKEVTRKKLSPTVPSVRHKFKVSGLKVYLHVGTFDDGTVGELFVIVSPGQGSMVDGMLSSFGKQVSNALQAGVPLADIVALHKNSRFEPNGPTGDADVPMCTSIPDFIVRWLEIKYLKPTVDNSPAATGESCPDCHSPLYRQAGCMVCLKPGCGFSKC